jgi:nitrate/nitrite transporter NarK
MNVAPTADPIAPRTQTRLVATSFMALFGIVGLVLYGLPNYYDFFVKDLGWTRADVTSGNMLGKALIGPLFGFAAGWMIDKVGPRKPMIIGILLAAIALIGLGNVSTLGAFYVFYALNALGYVLAGPLPNQVLLARNFKAARGRAMGIAYIGIGIGFLFVPQMTRGLIAMFDWRSALMILGVFVVVAAMPLVLLLKEGDGPAPVQAANVPKVSLKQVLSNRNFYLLALGSMASIGAVGGANQHFKMMMTLDYGWKQGEALNLVSYIAAVSLIGRFASGWLADKIGPKRVMLMVYGLVVAAMLLLVVGPTGSTLYLFILVFGLGLGGEYLIIPLMAGELFGTAVLGRVMGIVVTADGMAEAIFPWVVGKLRDAGGNYSSGFQLLTALATLGAFAIMLLPSSSASRRRPSPAALPSTTV